MQHHTVHCGSHAVLADAVVDVTAFAIVDIMRAQITGLGVV